MNTGNMDIDPVKLGVLWEKVQAMDKKIDRMEKQVEELLALANRSKGGLWLGMSIAAALSALASAFLNLLRGH